MWTCLEEFNKSFLAGPLGVSFVGLQQCPVNNLILYIRFCSSHANSRTSIKYSLHLHQFWSWTPLEKTAYFRTVTCMSYKDWPFQKLTSSTHSPPASTSYILLLICHLFSRNLFYFNFRPIYLSWWLPLILTLTVPHILARVLLHRIGSLYLH